MKIHPLPIKISRIYIFYIYILFIFYLNNIINNLNSKFEYNWNILINIHKTRILDISNFGIFLVLKNSVIFFIYIVHWKNNYLNRMNSYYFEIVIV